MPLTDKTILVTRDTTQAESFTSQLKKLGANVILFPTIEIKGPDEPEKVRNVLEDMGKYDWIIFTSTNAVSYFFEFVDVEQVDLNKMNIACIGKKTAEVLADFNHSPTLIPEKFSAQNVFKAMSEYDVNGKSILIPVSNLAAHEIENNLEALGAKVQRIEVYKTEAYQNPDIEIVHNMISDGFVDCITFFSPSAIQAFVQLMGNEIAKEINSKQVAIAVIGSTTAMAAQDKNLKPTIQPVQSENESFLEALKEYYSDR